jgi:FKBP-type peptidyl-prolyl cis-trans isomerase
MNIFSSVPRFDFISLIRYTSSMSTQTKQLLISIAVIIVVIGIFVAVLMRMSKDAPTPIMQNDVAATPATPEVQSVTVPPIITTNPSTKKSMNNTVTTPSGLSYTISHEGTGAIAKSGDTVSMNYTGMFSDGKKFDSNVDPAFQHVTPFTFTIGAGMVIKGWDEGIAGMKIGEKRTLHIPYTLGYGASGYGPIPAKADLTFDVELLDIK